ncbi:MAG: hypothetical protein LBQ62_01720 [Candidatus Accumulibacter sp.]|jgi:hypothetical protein|nr:hypothetical protein [Accumulibacter sp.]
MSADKFIQIENAAHSGAFGINAIPEPTGAQCIAGNYKVGRLRLYPAGVADDIAAGNGIIHNGQPLVENTQDALAGEWVYRGAADYDACITDATKIEDKVNSAAPSKTASTRGRPRWRRAARPRRLWRTARADICRRRRSSGSFSGR